MNIKLSSEKRIDEKMRLSFIYFHLLNFVKKQIWLDNNQIALDIFNGVYGYYVISQTCCFRKGKFARELLNQKLIRKKFNDDGTKDHGDIYDDEVMNFEKFVLF